MFIYLNKKAQSTAEYVIVLGLIVAAVVAMQTYIKRGLQGRVRDAVNYVDQSETKGVPVFSTDPQKQQYEPYYLSSDFATNRNSTETETLKDQGEVQRDLTAEHSSRTGSQTIDKGRADNF